MTCNGRPGIGPPRWPSAERLPDLPTRTTHSPVLASSPRRRRAFACVSTSCIRDRPVPHQSNRPGKGTTDGSASRPARFSLMADRAPLLRFRVPFSTRGLRRALAPEAAGLRTCPAAALTHLAPSARAIGSGPRGRRASALAVFRSFGAIGAASLEPADVRGGSFDRRERVALLIARACACNGQPVTRSSIEKTRSPSSSGPSRGWGRCSRLVFVLLVQLLPHARGGPVGPSAQGTFLSLTPRPSRRPSRVMHRRVL
jgi:hypothetical protein